jgi:acetyl esterase/lipase
LPFLVHLLARSYVVTKSDPSFLQERATTAGYVFISADYRLIPPATGHDIIDDIKDIFHFISQELNSKLSETVGDGASYRFRVDPYEIAVAGSSAGGQCAYYAAMHVSPKPKAVVLMYAMGGDYLVRVCISHSHSHSIPIMLFQTPQYLIEKTVPFFRGREILDRAQFSHYLHPFPDTLKLTSESPLSYNPPSSPMPGYPANPRQFLSRLYLQLGIFLDYLTGEHGGEHDPGLSDILQKSLASDKSDLAHSTGSDAFDTINERLKQLIPEQHHPLFPQFGITPDWPPIYMTHGALDSAVLVHESLHMHRLLENAGIDVTLRVEEGKEHSFDYEPDAEFVHGPRLFDAIGEFLRKHLENARGSRDPKNGV